MQGEPCGKKAVSPHPICPLINTREHLYKPYCIRKHIHFPESWWTNLDTRYMICVLRCIMRAPQPASASLKAPSTSFSPTRRTLACATNSSLDQESLILLFSFPRETTQEHREQQRHRHGVTGVYQVLSAAPRSLLSPYLSTAKCISGVWLYNICCPCPQDCLSSVYMVCMFWSR